MLLITECCVCGKEMSRQLCQCVGHDRDVEKTSHGLCGDACSKASMKAAPVWSWNADLNVGHSDKAYWVKADQGEDRLYYNREFVVCFINFVKSPAMVEMRVWDAELELYDVFTTFNTGADDAEEAIDNGRRWARADNMLLML